VWRPAPSLATSAEAWLTAGGPHHTALTTALSFDTLADFAQIANVELLRIDTNTTMRDFANEVRWNQVYYRLAGGL
jgi:L-arabinose isomerase